MNEEITPKFIFYRIHQVGKMPLMVAIKILHRQYMLLLNRITVEQQLGLKENGDPENQLSFIF